MQIAPLRNAHAFHLVRSPLHYSCTSHFLVLYKHVTERRQYKLALLLLLHLLPGVHSLPPCLP